MSPHFSDFNNEDVVVTTGELARHSSTTAVKMNKDFTKSALATKAHLNAALKRMSYIPSKKLKTTLREVKKGGIKALLEGFGLVISMIKNIEAMIIEYSRTPPNNMHDIKNGKKKNKIAAMSNIDEYISAVIQFSKEEQEDEDEEDGE
ncbi:hypothetical protein BDF20DRAFT_906480 [Mycotypha africana]|uniref:uncharacterized protein n=1 Tax=Mycotypha africana TaxID=64632 RepID=UPI0023017926|nr:uncharacterized protein BDF20DRAFT_906480 [Mycotypha africana]KAI8977469.1 hypothetical protein BDF20DRAFT_906480 [Mycotypha africana]